MKTIYLIILWLLLIPSLNAQTQSIQDLKDQRAILKVQSDRKQSQVDSLNNLVIKINKEISILTGWLTGFSGNIGFDFNKSNNWQASPNENASSSSLNIGLSTFANKVSEKTIWRNKGLFTKSWQDVDIRTADAGREKDNLFQNSTVDILNLSSLYGFRYSPTFGITGLAELSTSLENFLAVGTLDFGIGATWTPNKNLVLVVHPINYNLGFSSQEGVQLSGILGAKVRVEYTRNISVIGKELTWATTLTSFMPYTGRKISIPEDPTLPDGPTYEAGFMNYTFVNNLRFKLWHGIGVGIGFGFRNAAIESQNLQSYYSLGLSYSI